MFGADFPVYVPPDKLASVFVNLSFRGIRGVGVIRLYDPHYKPAVPHVLDHLKGFPVVHTASTAAAGLCNKLMLTVWTDGFVALFYARQCDFMAAGGAYASYIFATLVIVEKVCRHDGFYPACQSPWQGRYPFHTGYNGFFFGNLVFLSAMFQNSVLSGYEGLKPVCICMEITLHTLFVLIGVESTLAAEIVGTEVQTVKRCSTPRGAAVFFSIQSEEIIFGMKHDTEGLTIPSSNLFAWIDIQNQCPVRDGFDCCSDDIRDLFRMKGYRLRVRAYGQGWHMHGIFSCQFS